MTKTTAVNPKLQSAYDRFYSDRTTEWRELGARYKAENIRRVCEGRKFEKVLEWGAGEGGVLNALDKSGAFKELHALEISDSGIEQILKRQLPSLAKAIKFDGYWTPYGDKEFDLAYCSHVIEHVEHPRRLLRELRRVSRFLVFEIHLDYRPGVDDYAEHYLGYGHINIYTPSLFRFLLRSEGYRILAERYSHTSEEVVRFNWYKNMKLEKTVAREFSLRMLPLKRWWTRRRLGELRYREFGYSAYTCLAEGVGELEVLNN